MILSGCISTQQAYQSIDTRIYVFIAGAIPLGLAMQETGTANLDGRLAARLGIWHGISTGFYWHSFSQQDWLHRSCLTQRPLPCSHRSRSPWRRDWTSPRSPWSSPWPWRQSPPFLLPSGIMEIYWSMVPVIISFRDFRRVGVPLTSCSSNDCFTHGSHALAGLKRGVSAGEWGLSNKSRL